MTIKQFRVIRRYAAGFLPTLKRLHSAMNESVRYIVGACFAITAIIGANSPGKSQESVFSNNLKQPMRCADFTSISDEQTGFNCNFQIAQEPRAIASDVSSATGLNSAGYNRRGVAYSKRGDYRSAIANFTEALKLDELNAKAYHNRSIANLELGHFEQAFGDATKAVQLDGINSNYLNQLAWTYFRLGNMERGLYHANEALQIDDKNAAGYDTRGSIYEALGQPRKAIADFTRATLLDPTLRTSAEALNRLAAYSKLQLSTSDVVRLVKEKGWYVNLGTICAEFDIGDPNNCVFKQISVEDEHESRQYPRAFNVSEGASSNLIMFHLTPLVGEFFILSADGQFLKAFYRAKGRGYDPLPADDVRQEFNADLNFWIENLDRLAQGLIEKNAGTK